MRLLVVCVWIIVSLCMPAPAQVRVAGRVTNETNSPVAGARVTLEDVPATKSFEAVSDPTGSFQLQLPAPGAYSLKVDREDFYVVIEAVRSTVPATPPDEPPFEVARRVAIDPRNPLVDRGQGQSRHDRYGSSDAADHAQQPHALRRSVSESEQPSQRAADGPGRGAGFERRHPSVWRMRKTRLSTASRASN